MPVDYAKRGMDELPQVDSTELRHYAPHAGMICQTLDDRDDIGDEANTDVRYTLFGVTSLNRLESGQC